MGRRKATKVVETEPPTRKQSMYEGNGGHMSRKASMAPRNGEMSRMQSSHHLSRGQSKSGASFRRPSHPPNGNGQSTYTGFNVAPQQQQPPQQQQYYQDQQQYASAQQQHPQQQQQQQYYQDQQQYASAQQQEQQYYQDQQQHPQTLYPVRRQPSQFAPTSPQAYSPAPQDGGYQQVPYQRQPPPSSPQQQQQVYPGMQQYPMQPSYNPNMGPHAGQENGTPRNSGAGMEGAGAKGAVSPAKGGDGGAPSPSLQRRASQIRFVAGGNGADSNGGNGGNNAPQQPVPQPCFPPSQFQGQPQFRPGPPYAPHPMMNGAGGEGMSPQQLAHLHSLPQLPMVMTPYGPMAPPVQFVYLMSTAPQRTGGVAPPMPVMYTAPLSPLQQQQPSLQSRQSFRGPMCNQPMNGALHMQQQQQQQQQYMQQQQQQQYMQQQQQQQHYPDQPQQYMQPQPQPYMQRHPSHMHPVPPPMQVDPSAAQPANARLPHSHSILARASTAADAAPVAAEAPNEADADAAAGALPLPRTTSILTRRSSFKKVAPPPAAATQEADMASRLRAREEERVRLQQEMQARIAADQAAREQRLHDLRQRQTTRPNTLREPTADAAPRVLQEAPQARAPVAEVAAPPVKAPTPTAMKLSPLPPLSQTKSCPPLTHHTVAPLATSPPGMSVSRTSPSVASAYSFNNAGASQSSLGVATNRAHSPVPDTADLLPLLHSPVADKPPVRVGRSQPPAGVSRSAAPAAATAAVAAPAAASATSGEAAKAPAPLWHRSPTVVLYAVPPPSSTGEDEDGAAQVDASDFPVRRLGSTLRVQEPTLSGPAEFRVDEVALHRGGSTSVESTLLEKVADVFVAGYSASVLSVDAPGLAKAASAFDSAAWLAKQRLLVDVAVKVERMQAIYANQIGSSGATIEAAFSFALVKKASVRQAAAWGVQSSSTAQRTFEVVDLLQPESSSVPLKMHSCVLYGHRLSGVEYRTLRGEAEFAAALASAQANASSLLGRLADEAAADPENEALATELASVLQVVTCVLTHRKPGAVGLEEQLAEPAEAVFRREAASEVLSSDDEDDAAAPTAFRAHNAPSSNSDLILSCLTCIGAQTSSSLWTGALEHNQSAVPTSLFDTALGGSAFTVALASVDPTTAASATALATQAAVSMKLHRRPLNGSALRLIRSAKYRMAMAQHELNGPNRPPGAAQREIKAGIRKLAVSLDSLGKVLESLKVRRFSFPGDEA